MNDVSGDFLEYMDEAYSKANFYSCSISAKCLQKFEITTTVVNYLNFRSKVYQMLFLLDIQGLVNL